MSMFDPLVPTPIEPVTDPSGRTWHRTSDFRPGIHSSASIFGPPGYAKPSGTFHCFAAPSGALQPLPRLSQVITPPTLTGDPIDSEQFRISGTFANAPVYGATDNTTGVTECHTELFLASEYWDGSGQMVLSVHRYTRNLNTPAWEQVWSRTYPAATFDPLTRPRACFFFSQRSNPSAPDDSGPQVVGWVFTGNARVFPDPTNPTASSTSAIPGDQVDDPLAAGLVAPSYGLGHAGRIIIFPLYVTGDGADQVYISSEAAYWTAVNDHSTISPNIGSDYFNILGGYEQASGYGVFASLSAEELFLVKIRGGALIVGGNSIEDATVQTLPYVRSTGLSFCNGVITQLGYAYPVDSAGVWIWTGGDTSTHITKHLGGDFWRPSDLIPCQADPSAQSQSGWGYQNTACAPWNEFTLFPNAWVWDTDELGWWRMLDPDYLSIGHWATDERGVLAWGSPLGWSDGADAAFVEFSRYTNATYYRWSSHPRCHSIDRAVRLDEIVICAEGNGKIRVTVTSDLSDVSSNPPGVAEFIIPDVDVPTFFRLPVNVQGRTFEFVIESIGADHDESVGTIDLAATVDAPILHWYDYATLPSNQVAI